MLAHCGIFLISAVCLAQAPTPAISFEKKHHNFGKIFQDKKVSYKYKVKNSGSAPLHIIDVLTSCGCTYTVTGQRQIPPGESTFIEVQFDPTGIIGAIHKSVEVISNDPSSPNTQLTFEAGVIREIMPSTTVVFFNGISRSASDSSNIRLESGNEQPVVVTDVKIQGAPYLSCNPQSDGNDVILNIAIDGRLIPKQSFHGTDILTVRTTNMKVPLLHFTVQWHVESLIAATPDRITWTGAPGKEFRTTLSLRHTKGKPFRILDAKSSSFLIKAVGFSKDSALEQKFDVVLSPKAKAGALHEKLTIKFNDPDLPRLEIGIVAILR
ncbi:MAG: DUF1573 domain-containing protein [Holophagales bacterium]|jgi:hypothetical protein|nr:DUF1573 domain-containing protein [Holophagales bacterium]